MSHKLLIDESPLCFSRSLAQRIGLEKSIILQQVHFWLEINKRDGNNYFEDCFWVYSSLDQWQERDFIWWSKRKLITLFNELCDLGLLIRQQFNKSIGDCTNYYTINYELLDKISTEIYIKNEEKTVKKIIENQKQNSMPLCKICNTPSAEFATPLMQDLHKGYKDILINKIEKNIIEKNKENKYIYKTSSSIEIETPQKAENDDDDFGNKKCEYPSLFEIKEFIKNLENTNPKHSYISAEEFYAKMTALNWTSNGKKIQNWKAYYIRCCDNKQFRVDIENQKIKKGKSYDFTTSDNKAAYDRLLENTI